MKHYKTQSSGIRSPLLIVGFLLFLLGIATGCGNEIFINEFHYDNSGRDKNEFVEIAGPAGTDLSDYKVHFYKGKDGKNYKTSTFSSQTILTNQLNGYGFASLSVKGIKNGGRDGDGMALVDPQDNVLQFLSYEGTFKAKDGPARDQTSVDIGVRERGSGENDSLQLFGTGMCYDDFSWGASPVTNTRDNANTNQNFETEEASESAEPSPAPSSFPSLAPSSSPTPEPCSVNNLHSFDPSADPVTVLSFIAMGDIPYTTGGSTPYKERQCLNHQLRTIQPGHTFIVHIGDIKKGDINISPCDEEAYNDVAEIFTHPDNAINYNPEDCFFVVGDNEWPDCVSPPAVPAAEYWTRWTQHFGLGNQYNFGSFSDGTVVERQTNVTRQTGTPFEVTRQENFAFIKENILFMGINIVGGGPYGDEAERLGQNYEWVEGQLASHYPGIVAAVVFGHAYFGGSVRKVDFGDPFKTLLRAQYPMLPVMYLHGDSHKFCVRYPDTKNPNLVDVIVDDGDMAPPLIVSIIRNDNDGSHLFAIDEQGGAYAPGSCPIVEATTWNTTP